jgi:hypothetical protein
MPATPQQVYAKYGKLHKALASMTFQEIVDLLTEKKVIRILGVPPAFFIQS